MLLNLHIDITGTCRCNQKTASLYTYQSTYAIRKQHIIAVLHISKPWKWKKKKQNEKKGVGCEKGDAVSCPQVPVIDISTCVFNLLTERVFNFCFGRFSPNNSIFKIIWSLHTTIYQLRDQLRDLILITL